MVQYQRNRRNSIWTLDDQTALKMRNHGLKNYTKKSARNSSMAGLQTTERWGLALLQR
jgi:hypothetical protein